MKAVSFFFTLALLVGSQAFADASGCVHGKAGDDNTLLTCRLQGFTCKSVNSGSLCVMDKTHAPNGFTYSEPIAILIPPGITRPQNILLHLHGWKGVCEDLNAPPTVMERNFNFLTQMKNAGYDHSVLVIPMSRYHCDTYYAELQGQKQFERFTSYISGLLNPINDRWIISGHSGAGTVISTALSRNPAFMKKVDAVMMIDATYGIDRTLPYWDQIVSVNPKVLVHSNYTTNAGTAYGWDRLKSFMQQKGVGGNFRFGWVDDHCKVVGASKDPKVMTDYERFLKIAYIKTHPSHVQTKKPIFKPTHIPQPTKPLH